jgi:hypothetical protein
LQSSQGKGEGDCWSFCASSKLFLNQTLRWPLCH